MRSLLSINLRVTLGLLLVASFSAAYGTTSIQKQVSKHRALTNNREAHNSTLQSHYREKFPLPSSGTMNGWGVNIHFTVPQAGEIQQIADAGFKWVRMDFIWANIEKSQGIYDFSSYDILMNRLDEFHIRPIFILDYGNNLYQSGSPSNPSSVQAFCNFVSAAVRHFHNRGIVWEMWNEPNIGFWRPTPDVQNYVKLAAAVGKTIRTVSSEEWYIGPATSGFDFGFLETCFDSGLLQYFDAVSVHPYRASNPETVIHDWDKLKSLILQYEPKGRRIGIISSEWGYSSKVGGGISEAKQAEYSVRQYFTNIACGANLSIWYDWKNDGADPADGESNFGTVGHNRNPKPVYFAIQKFSHLLTGYHSVKLVSEKDSTSNGTIYIECFTPNLTSNIHKPSSKKILFLVWVSSQRESVTSLCGLHNFVIGPMPKPAPINLKSFINQFGPI